MRKRAYLGRVGAGLLIALAGFASVQALSNLEPRAVGAERAPLTTSTPSARSAGRAGAPTAPAPTATPTPSEPVAMIPAGRPSVRVPILMYHYIRFNPDPGDKLGHDLSVTPDDFKRQMDWLAENRYHPIDFEDLRNYLLGGSTLPARPVIITLDDGYRDLYTDAYPVLRSHGFKGVAYIISGFLGSPNNVSREQLLEMEGHGIQVGSHTISHPDLTKVPSGELHRQLQDSKAVLESLLGHPVVDFCYPGGAVNQAVAQSVQGAGYQTATTTAPGTAHSASDRYLWTRIRVHGGEPLNQFISELGPEEPTAVDARPRLLPAFVPTLPSRPPVMPGLELPPAPSPVAAPRGVTP